MMLVKTSIPFGSPPIAFPKNQQRNRRVRARRDTEARTASIDGPSEVDYRLQRRADGLVVGSAMAKLVDASLEGPKTHQEYCAIVGWGQCLSLLKSALAKSGHKLVITIVEGEKIRYSGK